MKEWRLVIYESDAIRREQGTTQIWYIYEIKGQCIRKVNYKEIRLHVDGWLLLAEYVSKNDLYWKYRTVMTDNQGYNYELILFKSR